MNKEKIYKVGNLYEEAVRAGLYGVEELHKYSDAEMAAMYNGIGPDFFPSDVREKVTDFLSLFEPAALIHDVRYSESDRTEETWHAANQEFLQNCLTLVRRKYGWLHVMKGGRAKLAAYAMFEAVESTAGWLAWTKRRDA